MKIGLLLVTVLTLLMVSSCAKRGNTTGGNADAPNYSPEYYYDSAHKISCYKLYSEEGLFCFKDLPNASQPANWIDLK